MQPLALSQTSGVPFYRQIEEQLTDRIRAGQLGPGDSLPSVRQLAAEVLVSVITVKQAYQGLEAAGLVVSRQGRGTFVAESGPAAARAELERDIASTLDAAIGRAAAFRVSRATVEAALAASFTRHFPRKP